MAASPISVVSGTEYPLEPGEWKYNNVLAAAGPTTFEVSTDGGASFRAMTDGVFTASGDAVFSWGRGEIFRATIQGGDTTDLTLVRGWGKGS